MRFVVMVLLGSFGIFLLLTARYRYDAVNLQVAKLKVVEGIVDSIGPEGELNLKYSVDATPYDITRTVPVNFPRIRAGDSVVLLYNPSRPDTAKIRHWSVLYQDSAVFGGFGVVAICFAVGAFVMMGSAAPVTPPRQPSDHPHQDAAVLDHPIELRNARNEFYLSLLMAAAGLAAAFFVYRNPWFLWTRWLAYPAAVVILVFGIGMIFAAFQNQTLRIRANQDGIEIEDSSGSSKFSWGDVASLKREAVTRSTWNSGRHFSRGYSSQTIGRYFILLDSAGKELLKLDEDVAMEPADDWRLLRAYILSRTGLPLQEETRETLL